MQSAFQGNDAERGGLLRRVGCILLFGFLRLGFANFTVGSFLAFGHGVFLCIGRQMDGLCCFARSDALGAPGGVLLLFLKTKSIPEILLS